MERLDKFLCDSGAGTRSQLKLLLKTGRVTLDGRAEKDGSRKIDPQCQQIALDGEVLGGKRRLVVMLNKPAGYVSSTEDRGKIVLELLPAELRRAHPEVTLQELAELHEPPLTKSAVNHRLRKLLALGNEA